MNQKKIGKRAIYLLIFLICSAVLSIIWYYIFKLDYTKFVIIFSIGFILSLLIFRLKTSEKIDTLEKELIKRYKNVEKKERTSEMISGQMYKIGSIRHNYIFSFNIVNKNCTFNNYYREEFQKNYNGNIYKHDPNEFNYSQYDYEYVILKNFIEYSFCLNSFLVQDTIIDQIKDILPNNCNICIKDNYLIITLETEINDIIDCDINDLILYVDYIDAIYQKLSTILPDKKTD